MVGCTKYRIIAARAVFTKLILLLFLLVPFYSCKTSVFTKRKYTKGRYIENTYKPSEPKQHYAIITKKEAIEKSLSKGQEVEFTKISSKPSYNILTISNSIFLKTKEAKKKTITISNIQHKYQTNKKKSIASSLLQKKDEKTEAQRQLKGAIKLCFIILLVLLFLAGIIGLAYLFEPGALIIYFILWVFIGALASIALFLLLVFSIIYVAKSKFKGKSNKNAKDNTFVEPPEGVESSGKTAEIRKKTKRFLKICFLILLTFLLIGLLTFIATILGFYQAYYIFIALFVATIITLVTMLIYFIIQTIRL